MSSKKPIPSPADLLDEVLGIISNEVRKIAELSNSTETLQLQDSKSLNDYAKTLMSSSREKRESAKSTKAETLSDAELFAKAKEALSVLGGEEEK